jgi:hypothetical protein
MKWTNQANEALTAFWNKHTDTAPYRDANVARLLGTTEQAVARQRSNLGLVTRKVPYHTRDAKGVIPELELPNYVLYYIKDGKEHYCTIRDANAEFLAKQKARTLMNGLGLKTAYIFKPHCQLVAREIVEIQL